MNTNETTKPPRVGGSALNDGLVDLLPCAHCGGTAALHQQKSNDGEEGGWFIECGNAACWMTTPLKFACMDDAAPLLAEIWNRRTKVHNAVLSGKPRTEL